MNEEECSFNIMHVQNAAEEIKWTNGISGMNFGVSVALLDPLQSDIV